MRSRRVGHKRQRIGKLPAQAAQAAQQLARQEGKRRMHAAGQRAGAGLQSAAGTAPDGRAARTCSWVLMSGFWSVSILRMRTAFPIFSATCTTQLFRGLSVVAGQSGDRRAVPPARRGTHKQHGTRASCSLANHASPGLPCQRCSPGGLHAAPAHPAGPWLCIALAP